MTAAYLGTKVQHVLKAKQSRKHHCHWPGCELQVPPAMWGCRAHWYSLPSDLRAPIWKAYRPGQEIDGTPSRQYIEAARRVQEWIAKNYPETQQRIPKQGDLL